jgi:hypothetical protein
MCSAPSSAAWVARKYEIPVLTVVLNNGGKPNFHLLIYTSNLSYLFISQAGKHRAILPHLSILTA